MTYDSSFELHPNLRSKVFVTDLPLSRVMMENESQYHWLFLIPRRPNVSKLIDLSLDDQIQLTKELDHVQRILWKAFNPKQLNVAAIGNKTPQLHVHVIARFENDPAWPGTVWDHPAREKLEVATLLTRSAQLKNLIDSGMIRDLKMTFTHNPVHE